MGGELIQCGKLNKGMIHLLAGQSRDGTRFHHMTQNSEQFKTHELLISGIFDLIFSDCS